MTMLITGLILFFAVHLIKPAAPNLRESLVSKLGDIPYKIAYSAIAGVGMALFIIGYKQAEYIWLWAPLPGSPFLTHGLMLPAALLLIAPYIPNSWGKRAQHPMMIGVLLWAIAHLWTNGHLKEVLLFGSFGLYSLIIMMKSDWNQTITAQPIWKNIVWIVAAILVYGVARMLHTI